MISLKRFLTLFVFMAFIMLFSIAAESQTSSFESRVHDGHLCARGSVWARTKNMVLHVESKGMELSALYDIKIYANRDMKLIIKNPRLTKNHSPGEAMMVAGRALLTKNIEIEENKAIDVLDGAALFRQLAITLIGLSSEKGPEKIVLPFHKKIKETKYPIKTSTQSASAFYMSPWNAVVDLKSKDKETIAFKIDFSFALEDEKKAGLQLHGHMSNYSEKNTNQNISDDLNISKWNQYSIGAITKKTGAGTIYDFGTAFVESRYETLGELRKYIQEKYK